MKSKTNRRPLTLLLMLVLSALLAQPLSAQTNIEVVSSTWDGKFRDHLTFNLEAKSSAEIVEVTLYYRIVGQLATSRNEATFTPGQSISAEFSIDQTKPENYMPPGTEVEYWWKVTDAAGNELKTDREKLTFLDNRYDWQLLQNERLTLYWYDGDQAFGQALFERANEALDTLGTDMGIAIKNPIKIFIYASHRDLLGAINSNSPEWTGGQAFSEHGVVVIGIESNPGSLAWGLNAMTHEMTHLVVHQATDNPLSALPRWLDEGIAVYNENQNELVADFKPQFERAVAKNQLMTLRTLSSPFPSDPVEANLAYGQSGEVVRFIVNHYGPEAMAKLLDIFAEGALYDEALQQALGVDTDGLDNAFRQSLELPPLPGTQIESAPAANSEAVTEPAPNAAVAPAAEEAPPAENNPAPQPQEKAPVVNEPPAQPEPAGATGLLPCMAGIVALLLMGGLVYGRR
ncbi:MAG: hypothetical protein FOGNACKC_01833 [Anaerolineae bacterium]|nr:hypothetical protein [Anaerolineae bacterium]